MSDCDGSGVRLGGWEGYGRDNDVSTKRSGGMRDAADYSDYIVPFDRQYSRRTKTPVPVHTMHLWCESLPIHLILLSGLIEI